MNTSTRPGVDLHYYVHDGSDALRFQLVGRLSKDAARDLEEAWRTALSVIGERRVVVDLGGLTSIDETGQELLSVWNRQGVLLGTITHQARTRLQSMTDQPITVLARAADPPTWCPFRTMRLWVAAFLVFVFPVSAADLSTERLKIRERCIQTAGALKNERTPTTP